MIETTPISVRQDDERLAFLRYLPKRIEAFEQRIRRYGKVGWDPAGMMVLRGDVQRLAETSGRYQLTEIRKHLLKLTQRVGDHIGKRSSPDAQQTTRMFELLTAVIDALALVPEHLPHPASSEAPRAAETAELVLAATEVRAEPVEPEPSMGSDNPVAPTEAVASVAPPEPVPTIAAAVSPEALEPARSPDHAAPAAANESVRRIYHLSDGNAFARDLGKRLESEGFAVEQLDSVDELSELVTCFLPQSLLVDASHLSGLAAVDALRREAQQRPRTPRRIQLIAMAADDGMETRRAAHRASVDLLLTAPFDLDDIVDRLQTLHSSAAEEKVRVLIVEDNRADAFYAQTVLINAGMQAHVEHDPMHVLESLELLHPDLILMDLHMPFANGVEVTLLIRDHPVFARVPIVFLSGESDLDSRLEAINAGGDDFLFKPIRPKNLVAAVRDRMRRMHPINK